MSTFTFEDLTTVMRRCAGDSADVDRLKEDALDVSFAELGLDSLAAIEMATVLEREFGLVLGDDVAAQDLTPRDLIDLVNQQLAAA
ncbi:acyl carrier protein [Streptomyces sp. NPDC101133]|uniref:acyl carrier protein n=1 Tax=Streptomyces sp. NPDC101133 TaxID=3366111 RepID=UPI003820E41B